MKRIFQILLSLFLFIGLTGFTYLDEETYSFDLNDLYDYQRGFYSEDFGVCSMSDVKTYMSYRAVTSRSSNQYQFLNYQCTVDRKTGLLYDEDGFIAVALGSIYGAIGTRYYFTLDSGIVLPLVKGDEKDDADTGWSGCEHAIDGSVIEFIIDSDIAMNYFGGSSNGLVLNGNFNNYSLFHGSIVAVEKVLDEEIDNRVTYSNNYSRPISQDIFYYSSGY